MAGWYWRFPSASQHLSRAHQTALLGCWAWRVGTYRPAPCFLVLPVNDCCSALGPPACLPCPCRAGSAEQIGLHAFRTRVFLPNNSPVAWADGVHQGGRKPAIAAAALQACKQLHEVSGWQRSVSVVVQAMLPNVAAAFLPATAVIAALRPSHPRCTLMPQSANNAGCALDAHRACLPPPM